MVSTFFSTPGGDTSRTSNRTANGPAEMKHVGYILTWQHNLGLVRSVVVHLQQLNSPESDVNIVSASVRLLGRFARYRRWPTSHYCRCKPIDRRATTSDTDGREQLTPLIISKLKQSRTGDTDGALAAKFDVLLSPPEEVVPDLTRTSRIPARLEHTAIRTESKQAQNEREKAMLTVRMGTER